MLNLSEKMQVVGRKVKVNINYVKAGCVGAGLFVAQTAAAAPSIAPADLDFPAVAATILTYVVAAVLAGLTLFGAVQGVKIGINLFKSIARTATS